MDGICVEVLNKINRLASTGRYVVFLEDELSEALPENADVKKALKELKDGGYIDVKYSSGNTYCIAPLKSYEIEVPLPLEEPKENAEEIKKAFPPFWAAFAGGAAGSSVISLIFTILWYAG